MHMHHMNSHTETIQQSIEYIFKSREYKKYDDFCIFFPVQYWQ